MLLEKIPVKLASSLVIGYMVLAFGWWAWHLWSKNDRLFEVEKMALEARFSDAGKSGINLTRMYETVEYKRAEKNWRKSRRMIVSEGLFFMACLVFGLWIVHRSANREVKLARQRRNRAGPAEPAVLGPARLGARGVDVRPLLEETADGEIDERLEALLGVVHGRHPWPRPAVSSSVGDRAPCARPRGPTRS